MCDWQIHRAAESFVRVPSREEWMRLVMKDRDRAF